MVDKLRHGPRRPAPRPAHPELSWSEETAHLRGGLETGRAGRLDADATSAPAPPRTSVPTGRSSPSGRHGRAAVDTTDDPWASTTPASPTPAATTCTRPALPVPAARPSREVHDAGTADRAASGCCSSRPRGHAAAARWPDARARSKSRSRSCFALHCDPRVDVGQSGCARAAHRVQPTPWRRLHGWRGSISPTAPDRRPHLRPRQGTHRAARGPVPPDRPAGRRQRGVGRRCAPAGAQRDPRRRARSTGTVRMLDAVAWADAAPWSAPIVADIVRRRTA